jgi:hypothetical protein
MNYTAKQILSENRESVISSIKWVFKVWKSEDVKQKMIEFLAFCEENMNIEQISESKKIKSDLKVLVQKMAISQKVIDNRKWYEIANDIADKNGLTWCSKTGNFLNINNQIVNL